MNLFVEGNIYDIGGVNIFRVISFCEMVGEVFENFMNKIKIKNMFNFFMKVSDYIE